MVDGEIGWKGRTGYQQCGEQGEALDLNCKAKGKTLYVASDSSEKKRWARMDEV